MGRTWILEVEADASNRDGCLIRLGVEGMETNRLVDLIAPCRSAEEFQKEIEKLVDELNQLPQKAREKMASLNITDDAEEELAPGKIWKEMEALATEAEMTKFFNAFSENQRQQIAEYVFSHVNMFKGRGPIFSEHYDSASHLLV